jgi:uncharacterized protein (DUF58 family)
MVLTTRFFALLTIGLVQLSLTWAWPKLRWATLAYDVILFLVAYIDARTSPLPTGLEIRREIDERFSVGAETNVQIKASNKRSEPVTIVVKDEYPPEMVLSDVREAKMKVDGDSSLALVYGLKAPRRGQFEFGRIAVRYRSRLGLVWCQTRVGIPQSVKVYPNMRRAREAELKLLGERSLVAARRRASWRGEGRDFESLRDYVPGDELRHVSWTATARRGKLVTRQYQIERDQSIIIALDAGRLMTSRIEQETKLDMAIHAALALMSAAMRGGDNVGLVVFGRRIKTFIPPGRGREQTETVLEALHDMEPEMIEPSYTRAFEFIYSKCKKRSLVAVLTDLVDEEGSSELLKSLDLLRPRHLPLVVTIGDRDLQAAVREVPNKVQDLFVQSVAEEIIYQREAALRLVESRGGLALDVTAVSITPALLETYMRVKERGLL